MTVDGTVRAPLLVLTGHSVEYGDTDVEHALDDPDEGELAARFVEEALDSGHLSRDTLLGLFRAGKPALKPAPAQRGPHRLRHLPPTGSRHVC